MPTPAEIFQQRQRQVHLDFHTSPLIPDVASEFDPAAFAAAFAAARVNSVTLFAKCHHGMHYYPTALGRQHPALHGRDLLGEQIEALHRVGIRCPLYTSVAWEEDAAARHPEWRQILRDGTPAERRPDPDQPGAWKALNFLDPAYQDYIEAHLREVCARYGEAVDGFFLDILLFEPGACWSETSRRFREAQGLPDDGSLAARQRFESAAQGAFARRFTKLLRGLAPGATIFYNAASDPSVDSSVGPRMRSPQVTHFEIESLPSGQWGYYHFPRVARAISLWGKPWLGMTGRFQKEWGDFGGIKSCEALEYECFRTQALGGANSVGDHLPPRGALDRDAYAIIGEVYAQCEAAEPFYAGSESLPQFGCLLAAFPGVDPAEAIKSEEGVILMAQERHRDVAMLDERAELSPFPLIQLPDSTVITPILGVKLRAFYEEGGRLLLSHRAGFDAEGRWALDFLPLRFPQNAKNVEAHPTYWRARPETVDAIGASDRVCYLPGLNVTAGAGARAIVDRVLPYFPRSETAFSSHFQTPPAPEPDPHPAVVTGERFVYFADPIFREFRQAGNCMVREMWHRAMNDLGNAPRFGDGLPKTILVVPRRRGGDLILTLLHYIPVRKALDRDVIDERSSFAGERLRLPPLARFARIFNGPALERADDGAFLLPNTKGRLLIEVPGFFAST